jgi:hypothetical protein
VGEPHEPLTLGGGKGAHHGGGLCGYLLCLLVMARGLGEAAVKAGGGMSVGSDKSVARFLGFLGQAAPRR